MKVICRQRQTGRTTELIEECASYDCAVIVAPNMRRASYIHNMAKDMGKIIGMPITMHEFVNHMYNGRFIKAFLFDDLDASLQSLSEVPIKTVVFKGES